VSLNYFLTIVLWISFRFVEKAETL
jgi:hypothetical protein